MFDPSLPETLHKMAKSLGLGGSRMLNPMGRQE